MIRVKQAIKLARTKLRTRPIRLGALLVTMSVMFAGLVFVANVASGVVGSLKTFGHEGFGGRYLVQAHPVTYGAYDDTTLTSQLQPQQDELIAQKKALAKKLGITYDPANDPLLYFGNTQSGPSASDTTKLVNNSPLGLAALDAQNRAIPGTSYDSFVARAKQAGATHFYRSSENSGGQGSGSTAGTTAVLVDGKEDYTHGSSGQSQYTPTGVMSIQTLGWKQMSAGLLRPFLLPNQTTAPGADGSIPIVAPYSAAEQILGLSPLPTTATSDQKLQRLVQVRSQIAGKTALLCYRNAASEALLQKAIQQQADIAANKGKSGYTPPHLQYALPTAACGATTIKSDKRTVDEKADDAKQQTFDSTFNPVSDPDQGVITLRIVGLAPDVDTGGGGSLSLTSLLSSALGATIGYGWFSPAEAFTAGSIAMQAQNGLIADQPMNQQEYYAEFPTLAAAHSFIKQANCQAGNNTRGVNGVYMYDPTSQLKSCLAQHRPLYVYAYGNNADAIASFQHGLWKVLRFVLLAMIVIATIVMAGTFGKVIADSRRETAVFRALGATRLDLSQIYRTYTVMVGLLVTAVAIALGSIGAQIISNRLAPGLSVNAVLVYNARNPHMHFNLAGFDVWYLGAIVLLVLLVSLLSAVIPLLANMRRNPIRDMRDE
jgi:hypothetical protein